MERAQNTASPPLAPEVLFAFPLTTEATQEAEIVQCGFSSKEEAGWTTEKSPKGIEVLRQSTAPEMFWLSIYMISLSCIFFSLKKGICVSRRCLFWLGERRNLTKTNQFPCRSPVLSLTPLFSHTSLRVDADDDWFLILFLRA